VSVAIGTTVPFSSGSRLDSTATVPSTNTAVIFATSGKIIDVSSEVFLEARFPPATDYHEYSPKYLIPGQADAHVHLNEPGWRTEWECFETATRAAAFGGVTTLIYMPLNAIPSTTTVEKFQKKVNAAKYYDYSLKSQIAKSVRVLRSFNTTSRLTTSTTVCVPVYRFECPARRELERIPRVSDIVAPAPRGYGCLHSGTLVSYITFLGLAPY
jgi:hypothetical protein